MALTADGTRIVTAGSRGAFVWDRQSGGLIREFDGYKVGFQEPVRSIALSPDGTKLVVSAGSQLVLWNLDSGEILRRLSPSTWFSHVAFSPDGKKFIAAEYGKLSIWGVDTGQLQIEVDIGSEAVPTSSLAISLDGSRGVTSSDAVRVWDLETGDLVRTIAHPMRDVYAAAFSPDRRKLLLGGSVSNPTLNRDTAKTVLLDIETGQVLHELEGEGNDVYSVAFSPDGTKFLTGEGTYWWSADSRAFALWDTATGILIRRFGGYSSWLAPSPAFANGGNSILAPFGQAAIGEWDINTGDMLRSYDWHVPSYSFWEAVLSPDGSRVATAGWSGARVWDFATGEILHELGDGHTLALSRSGDRVLTGNGIFDGFSDTNASVRLWDMATGALVRTLTGHVSNVGGVRSVAISPDGRFLLSSGADGARLWNADDGSLLRFFAACSNGVNSVAFSQDGTQMLTAPSCTGLGANLWDLESGSLVKAFGQGLGVYYAEFTADGQGVRAGGWGTETSPSTSIWVWDRETGNLRSALTNLPGSFQYSIYKARFSHDERWILVGMPLGGRAMLLDAETGDIVRQFRVPLAVGDFIASAFAPGGGHVLTGGEDGTAWLWDIRDLNLRIGPAIVADDGRLRLRLSGAIGHRVRVQRSINLKDWADWKTVTLGDTGCELTDTITASQCFYRAVEDNSAQEAIKPRMDANDRE
jgi:WD40 repeat protein